MSFRTSTIVASTFGAMALAMIAPLLRSSPTSRSLTHIRSNRPLPTGFSRFSIPGPAGSLEILTNAQGDASTPTDARLAPLLLVHGGMGSARCYDHWMQYLASQDRTVYALSLRGHGLSTRPRDFARTTKAGFALDLAAAISHISSAHPNAPKPVLVGHSAGGGLSQYCLSESLASVSGIVLVAPYPPSGGWPVFINWGQMDPFFFLRFVWQGCDPNSPLSSPALVKQAFFADNTTCDMNEFFKQVNPEESINWSYTQMLSFVDAEKVKKAVDGKVHIIHAREDRLMSPNIMRKMASMYGIKPDVVEHSGHHIMWDDSWKDGVQYLVKKLEEWRL